MSQRECQETQGHGRWWTWWWAVQAGEKVPNFFIRVRVGTLGRRRWGVETVHPSVVGSHDRVVAKTGVMNGGHECESRNGVASGSRTMGSHEWVAKIKKIRGICKGYPKGSNKLIKKLYEINKQCRKYKPQVVGTFLRA